MFEIYNKRKQFWQWDTGQRLIVNADVCSEVHFCNGTSDCSLVCEVYEEDGLRLVNVPNILLQMPKAIKVYAFICDGDETYTQLQKIFPVFPRTKPADYSYTEVEIIRYETLEARIAKLEKNGVGGSGVPGLVFDTVADMEAYIAENAGTLKVGQDLFIRETDAPDYWWDGTAAVPVETDLSGVKKELSELSTAIADLPKSNDEEIEMLIAADLLPAVTTVSSAILTDSKGNVILRY